MQIFTRILVSFTFYPEDLLHHRLRDLGHGYKSLLYSHRCGQEVPGLSLYRIRFPASELQKNDERCDNLRFYWCHFQNGLFYGTLHKWFIKCHLPSSPVWIFFHLFYCGKSHCHLNSLLPPWYLSERAWGSFTEPKPAFKSSSWIFSKFSIWDFNSQMSV